MGMNETSKIKRKGIIYSLRDDIAREQLAKKYVKPETGIPKTDLEKSVRDAIDFIESGDYNQNPSTSPVITQPDIVEVTTFGIGTFQQAWNAARQNQNTMFQWWLNDTDTFGNQVLKMIWHIGSQNEQPLFKDALGATIMGRIDGLTILCQSPCDMRVVYRDTSDSITNIVNISLQTGINNFSITDNDSIFSKYVITFEFKQTGTNVRDTTSVVAIDFGNLVLRWTAVVDNANYTETFLSNLTNLQTIDRLVLGDDYNHKICANCPSLIYANVSTVTNHPITASSKLFSGCKGLELIDLSNFYFSGTNLSTSFCGIEDRLNGVSYNVSSLKKLDIRNFDTSRVTASGSFDSFLARCTSLRQLVIGKFTIKNGSFTNESIKYPFYRVHDAILICTETTPPTQEYDWIDGHFIKIYVPSDAVTTYKNDSWWGNYKSIIYSIDEYQSNDAIEYNEELME